MTQQVHWASSRAAHCADNLVYYNGGADPVENTAQIWQAFDPVRDIQYHTTGGAETGKVWDGTFVRDLYDQVLRANQLGHYICHYGYNTGYSCGNVAAIDFIPPFGYCGGLGCAPNWIRVTGPNLIGNFGDSGGPWFVGGLAYGVLSGGVGGAPSNNLILTAVDYINQNGIYLIFWD